MSDYGPDCGGRIKGVSIVKPIVYGNVARYFGKKREEDGHTHSWNVYVKPFHNEDMSTYVKKVHFKLHESYANPNRIVTKPPFEVTETGWGEFEVSIKLYFMDPNERPITIYHILKLFETDPTSKQIHIKKYIISEFYDEIIFQDPSAMMQQLLTNTRQLTIGPYKHETDFEEKKHKTIASIQSAKVKVKTEIEELKDRLKQTQTAIAKFKENIASTEAKQEKEQKQLQAQLQQQAVVASAQSVSSQESQQTPVKAQAQIQPMQQVVETGVTSGFQLETQTEQVKPPSESLQSIQEIQPEPMELQQTKPLQQHPQPIEKEISGIQVIDQQSETTTLQSDRVQTETK